MRIDRSFAFVDLCGFTSFTDEHGDEEAVVVLARFRANAREVASTNGVRLAKWLGDGAMLVGVECEPLVACVLELEERIDDDQSPLALRAGIAPGAVISFEGEDYIGSAVNLASRLCDLADGHQVLAHKDVEGHVPSWARAGATSLVTVPGFHRPVPVVRLARAAERAAGHLGA